MIKSVNVGLLGSRLLNSYLFQKNSALSAISAFSILYSFSVTSVFSVVKTNYWDSFDEKVAVLFGGNFREIC
jgi:hypothetical protein